MYLNKAILVGRITKKPELRSTSGGIKVTNFGLAISENYKTLNGEKKEVTDFIDVTIFGTLAETCAQWLVKGQQVIVEGKVKTRKYEKDGETRFITYVQAQQVQFGAKPNNKEGDSTKAEKPPKAEGGKDVHVAQGDGYEYPTEDINPEDIPF